MDKKIKPLIYGRFFSVKNPVSKFSKKNDYYLVVSNIMMLHGLYREQTRIDFITNSRIDFFLINHINF
jgi:hypothetical protein